MEKLLNFFAPPNPEHGEAGVRRFFWGVSLGMYAYATFALWAIGMGSIIGLEQSGFAFSKQAEANKQAVEDVKQTVKCGNLQTIIANLNSSIYEVERQIEVDGVNARDTDRRRLTDLRQELRQKEDAFRSLNCALILDG